MRTLLQRGMRLSAIGECGKRLLAYSPKALSELIPRISQEIIIQNEKIIKIFQFEDFCHLPPVLATPVVHLELRISPRNFEKI